MRRPLGSLRRERGTKAAHLGAPRSRSVFVGAPGCPWGQLGLWSARERRPGCRSSRPSGEHGPVARGRRPDESSRPRARPEIAVVPFPRSRLGGRLALRRLAPSGRSIAVGLGVLALGAAAYGAARVTSVFAVRTIAVEGSSPAVARQVRAALAEARGQSLLALDLAAMSRRAEAVPVVASVALDRSFPHTLTASVVLERPVAVVRRGAESWLVSARGRVTRALRRGARPRLPRIWLTRQVPVQLGAMLAGDAAAAVEAVAPLAGTPLPARIASARRTPEGLALALRSGVEIRLGDARQLPLKLRVAGRLLPLLAPEERYLDVSVPERPVAGKSLKSKVEPETPTSTSA